MNRIASILLFVLLHAVSMAAAIRTTDEALRIAAAFTAPSGQLRAPARDAQTGTVVAADSIIIAVNTRGGYVLVGADDRLPQVLGYSDTGAFDATNVAPALRYWLQCYAQELGGLSAAETPVSKPSKSSRAVSPLLTCRWNQSAPYNDLAPVYNTSGSRSATGCVATAMAQVMYYYKYPEHGTGSHAYFWECTNPVGQYATLSADFGATTYAWTDMLDSYRSAYTSVQAEAVATLMYHCGVAIDMGYGASSGAFTDKVPKALSTYFGYDTRYQRIQKIMYSADSLNAIVYGELAARRPVIVSGSNDEGGHAFVCDGSDGNGYFHINWGWGGSNDGYYLLTALNPGKSQGIGGTTKGYNKGTAFYIGLQPLTGDAPPAVPQMATTDFSVSTAQFARTESFSVAISKLQNYGLTNFSGSYGVALYDEDETAPVAVLSHVDNYSLSAGYYRTTVATLSGITIPAGIPDGTYHLCAVYRDAEHDWMRMMCTQDDYYRTLTITDTHVTFYPNDAEPLLSLTAPIAFPNDVNADSVPYTGVPLSFSISNNGGTFRGEISARIYKGNFSKGQYEVMQDVVIRRNQSLNSALQQAFDANLLLDTQYKMKLCWRADASDAWHDFTPAEYAVLPFKLYDPDYCLALTDTIRFVRNDSVPRSNALLTYSIKNTGAPFVGELQLSFYDTYFSRGKSDIQQVSIATNQTLTGSFFGPLDLPEGRYTFVLRYRDLDGEWQEFVDKNNCNIGSIEAFVYNDTPGPTTGIVPDRLQQASPAIFVMRIGDYDLFIRPVSTGETVMYQKVFLPAK
ncbi:MAG: C10 family peptidase [Paludibacteraceae bacterium]|nr:C10 family peptidase [Paludibacteraceae bacterium]